MRKIFLTCFEIDRVKNGIIICIFLAVLVGLGVIFWLDDSSLSTLIFALGVVAIFEVNKLLDSGVQKESIIINKIIGVWITLISIFYGAIKYNFSHPILVAGVVSFVSFLLFTLWRPSTIGWLDKNLKGGLGVVLSEVLAGFSGAVLGLLILSIFNF